MKNRNRLFAFIFLLMAIQFFFFTETAYSKNVELRFSWWGGDSRTQATLAAINLYMKKNPNMNITPEYSSYKGYEKNCLSQLAGGTAPDIIQLDQPWLENFMNLGNLFVDLYQYKSIIKLDGFDKKFLNDMCVVNNKLVGLPTGLNASTYIINKDFLKRYKVNLDTEWNWENLLDIGTRIHNQNKNAYLMDAVPDQVWEMVKSYVVNQSGKPFILNDYTIGFNKNMITDAFIYCRKLYDAGVLLQFEDSYLFEGTSHTNIKWINGDIGMCVGWASAYTEYLSKKFESGVMLPSFTKNAKNSGIVVRPSQALALNSKGANIKEAVKFLDWFFNDPEAIVILKTERGVPATENGRKILADKKILDKNISHAVNLGIKYAGLPENPITYSSELLDIFKDILQKIAFNKLSPEQAAEEFINRFQGKLAEIKNRK